MKIEQITTSRMVADEGKVFIRKRDGYIEGPAITLGYNYYEAGLPLLAPHATKPEDYDEIDIPENWNERSVIKPTKVLKRATDICKTYTKEINNYELSAAEALQVQSWFPTLFVTEGYKEGEVIEIGYRVQHEGKLWEALQSHTIAEVYAPSLATASLWKEVAEESAGSIDNPIPYDGNMALEEGKYYSQEGVVYLCTRSTGVPVYNALSDLVGIYVALVTE